MSHENIPTLIITAPPRSPDTQNIDHLNQALKQHPASQKRGNHIKPNIKRARNSKQNDKSEPLRRNEISNSYNNVSLLSIEKKLHDESCLDNISNSSRSIFSTESPRDLKTISSLKQKSYYLGVINHNEGSRLSQQNPKSSFAGKSVFPSITLDESHANLRKNETLVGGENGQKNTSKVQSLNVIQSKRSSSIGLKFYHGFKKTYASQNLTDQTESFEITRLHSPQQKDLILPSSVNIDKQKSTEEANHIPKPPSKDQPKKSKTLAPPALDHRRSRRVITEPSSTIMKTNTELDSKTLNSLPVDTVAPSLLSLPINDMTLESGHLITESDWVSKHRKLKLDAEKKPATRLSLDPLGTKENYVSSQTDLSNPQTYHHTMKIPLKPLSNNINGSVKRSSIIKPPSSEMRPSSREDLMRRFNEIVTSHTQPAQQGNQQEKNKNERQTLKPINMKEKENNFRKSLKKQQDENGTEVVGSKTKKSVEMSAALSTDAKIMLLKSKIKDSEYKRKTRKNQRIEEGECDLNGLPLKSKATEQFENKAEVEEEMKRKLLVMRKIQLYDILIKQKVGKKLPKEALRLVKAEFDKVNVELNELKMQHD